MSKPHSHYFKPCPFDEVDVYRVLLMFEVTDPCIGHAVKKLLCAGARGAKGLDQDVAEAIATLTRWQAMREEEKRAALRKEAQRLPPATPLERMQELMKSGCAPGGTLPTEQEVRALFTPCVEPDK